MVWIVALSLDDSDIIILLVSFLLIINTEMMVRNIKLYKDLSHLMDALLQEKMLL